MLIEDVRAYIKTLNLNDYDLGGCEVDTDEDCEIILKRLNNSNDTLENIVENYLYEIREILDNGIEDDIEE